MQKQLTLQSLMTLELEFSINYSFVIIDLVNIY